MKHLLGMALFIAGIGLILFVFFRLAEDYPTQFKNTIGTLVFAILTVFWGILILRRLKD